MAHGRRALSENGGSANKPRASARGSRKGAALPLKFFNVKTSERFVFKRRDKRCLTLSPRSSLIPVFIHFSDFFPDLVQATLTKCKALILGCERVVILRPNQGKPMIDDVVWEGPGASLPDRCWDRQGVILRTLDIVAYKVGARDRKRDLLPIEQQLWDVMGPFLRRIRDFAKSLNDGAVELEQHMDDEDAICNVLQGQAPWCVRIAAVLTDASPAVGDREHILYYSPKNGVFTREFIDYPEDEDKDSGIPLVTLPCRLQSVMPTHPSVPQVLRYLVSVAERVASKELRGKLQVLADRYPVPEEPVKGQAQEEQDPQQQQREENQQHDRTPANQLPLPSEDGDRTPQTAGDGNPQTAGACSGGGHVSREAGSLCVSGNAGVEAAARGDKRVRVERHSERAKSKRLKSAGSHTAED